MAPGGKEAPQARSSLKPFSGSGLPNIFACISMLAYQVLKDSLRSLFEPFSTNGS